MDRHEQIAAEIFTQHGVDFRTAKKGNGWTNRTWLAGGLVLRLSAATNTERIRREVRLASHLPNVVGYPEHVASGVTDGYEWSLSKEIPGVNLSEAWPSLSWYERKREIQRIFHIAQAIHTVDVAQVRDCASQRAWYSSFNTEEALSGMERLAQRNVLYSEQERTLTHALMRFFARLPNAEKALNHGYITMDNVIWNNGIASLLDFEHAAIAPVQLDLYSILRFCFGPDSIGDVPVSGDNRELLGFQAEVIRLAKSMLADKDEFDLLIGFAILISLRRMEIWLENSDNPDGFTGWEPYRCLQSLADGRGGYLAPLLACIG